MIFLPRLDILPEPQLRLWRELSATPAPFVLYGGTAIALLLGHRNSVDFDFFGDQPLDPERLALGIPYLSDAVVTQRAPNTLSCVVDRGGPVKLSFFGVPRLPRLRAPFIASDNGLRVASLLDLFGAKAAVIQLRAEAKDYWDIDALLRDGRVDLPMALAGAQAMYGATFNPQVTLKALSYFDDGALSALPKKLKSRLARAVSTVDLNRLPKVTPSGEKGTPKR